MKQKEQKNRKENSKTDTKNIENQQIQITRIRRVVSLCYMCLNRLLISALAAGLAIDMPQIVAKESAACKKNIFKCPLTHTNTHTHAHTLTPSYMWKGAHALAFGGGFNA